MKGLKLVFASIVLLFTLSSCEYMNDVELECVEVTGKERIYSNEESFYLVFTDHGEFKVTDQLFRGNFSSTTWYAKFHDGEKYSFRISGYRVPFLSIYPVVSSEPKKCN